LGAERRQVDPASQESFLGHVFRQAGIAAQAVDHPHHARIVTADQLSEGIPVALLGLFNQGVFIFRNLGVYHQIASLPCDLLS
jgi:hypothetical protein